jgi:hypothetical protein
VCIGFTVGYNGCVKPGSAVELDKADLLLNQMRHTSTQTRHILAPSLAELPTRTRPLRGRASHDRGPAPVLYTNTAIQSMDVKRTTLILADSVNHSFRNPCSNYNNHSSDRYICRFKKGGQARSYGYADGA